MKAIIPAAGLGTRFLPVTRVVPKEMLPVGSRPALELIVEEAKRAGADEITIVISKSKEMIREYFAGDPSVRFVYQERQRGLGDAVLSAGIDGEDVMILLGDVLVSGCDALREMVLAARSCGADGAIGCERVPIEKSSRYGMMKVQGGFVADIVEKPSPAESPGDIAVAGRYFLPGAIFGYLKTQTPGKGGEIQLTDAIRRMLSEKKIVSYVYPGKRHDLGNPKGYLEALLAMGENG